MRNLRQALVLIVAACAVLMSAPAFARAVTVKDPVGDGSQGDRLDITAVKVANRDHAIVTTVSVVRVGHGQLAVWIQARGDSRRSPVVVATAHRSAGDTAHLFNAEGAAMCTGLRAVWDEASDRVHVRVPARCFDDGNYGAVRVRTITEIHGGEDVDLGPNGPRGHWLWTKFVSRG